jgi:hypothetical protein
LDAKFNIPPLPMPASYLPGFLASTAVPVPRGTPAEAAQSARATSEAAQSARAVSVAALADDSAPPAWAAALQATMNQVKDTCIEHTRAMDNMTQQFDAMKLEVAQTRTRIDKIEHQVSDLTHAVSRDVRELNDKIREMETSIRAEIKRDLMNELREVCLAQVKSEISASAKSLKFAPAAPSAPTADRGVACVPRCFFLKGGAVYGDASTELPKDEAERLAHFVLSLLPASDKDCIDTARPLCPYRRNRQATFHLRADAPNCVRELCATINDLLKEKDYRVKGRALWAQPDADQHTKAKRAAVAKGLAALRDEVKSGEWRFEPDWPSGGIWATKSHAHDGHRVEIEVGVFQRARGWKWHAEVVKQHLIIEVAVLDAAIVS